MKLPGKYNCSTSERGAVFKSKNFWHKTNMNQMYGPEYYTYFQGECVWHQGCWSVYHTQVNQYDFVYRGHTITQRAGFKPEIIDMIMSNPPDPSCERAREYVEKADQLIDERAEFTKGRSSMLYPNGYVCHEVGSFSNSSNFEEYIEKITEENRDRATKIFWSVYGIDSEGHEHCISDSNDVDYAKKLAEELNTLVAFFKANGNPRVSQIKIDVMWHKVEELDYYINAIARLNKNVSGVEVLTDENQMKDTEDLTEQYKKLGVIDE